MNINSINLLKDLSTNLDGIIKVYRKLLDIVRKEREYLVEANITELEINNNSKEAFLKKLGELETKRVLLVNELGINEGLGNTETKLLDLAVHFQGETGDKLRRYHSVLVLLLKRLKDHNSENQKLINAGLENVTGAMSSIKDILKDKMTYERKGKAKDQESGLQGNFISREA